MTTIVGSVGFMSADLLGTMREIARIPSQIQRHHDGRFRVHRIDVGDRAAWYRLVFLYDSVRSTNGLTTLNPMTDPARPVICSFESRRAEEMSSLIERLGGQAVSAPSMREIPIEDNPVAIQFIHDVIANRFSAVILLTGVGTAALFEVARSQNLYEPLLDAFHRTTLIIRGPKPAAVLGRLGLKYAVRAPEPNTWRELLAAIDQSELTLSGQTVAVQEYGLPNARLYAELAARGVDVRPVPVYRWALPEDIRPLELALKQIASGGVDAVLFTSANQVSSVLGVAERLNVVDGFRSAVAASTLVASIGPTCSEAIVDNGLPVHFEASPPKMGPLVRGVIEACISRRAGPSGPSAESRAP